MFSRRHIEWIQVTHSKTKRRRKRAQLIQRRSKRCGRHKRPMAIQLIGTTNRVSLCATRGLVLSFVDWCIVAYWSEIPATGKNMDMCFYVWQNSLVDLVKYSGRRVGRFWWGFTWNLLLVRSVHTLGHLNKVDIQESMEFVKLCRKNHQSNIKSSAKILRALDVGAGFTFVIVRTSALSCHLLQELAEQLCIYWVNCLIKSISSSQTWDSSSKRERKFRLPSPVSDSPHFRLCDWPTLETMTRWISRNTSSEFHTVAQVLCHLVSVGHQLLDRHRLQKRLDALQKCFDWKWVICCFSHTQTNVALHVLSCVVW